MSHIATRLAEFGVEDVKAMVNEAKEADLDPVVWVAHHILDKGLSKLTPLELQLVRAELKTFGIQV